MIDLMPIRAEGRVLHHFHGDYFATVILSFPSSGDAALALPRLPLPGEWIRSETRDNVVVWRGGSEQLDALKTAAADCIDVPPCGFSHCRDQCRGAPIDACAHSIDTGPAFTLTVRTAHPGQVDFSARFPAAFLQAPARA